VDSKKSQTVPVAVDPKNRILRRDEKLVEAAQAGSASAFAELRNMYSRRVYRTILSITRNKEDAEDALQDSFLKAYVALASFEGRANFYSWLTRIAINTSLMILRKRRARPETSLHPVTEQEENIPLLEIRDSAPNPEQSYEHRQQHQSLLRAIGKLPTNLREVVEIRAMRECTLLETAHILDISQAATKSRLYRARTRLATSRANSNLSRNHLVRPTVAELDRMA
jgi:RNA polymerase sigma-70 factor (ECF subfamily)